MNNSFISDAVCHKLAMADAFFGELLPVGFRCLKEMQDRVVREIYEGMKKYYEKSGESLKSEVKEVSIE
jgi:hypothetical protein